MIQNYTIETAKLMKPVKLVIVSDLHGCPYGEGQSRLLAAMTAAKPDGVLMAGDMNDDRKSDAFFWEFMQGATKIAPCYYVMGNHDYGRHSYSVSQNSRAGAVLEKDKLRDLGIMVLDGAKRQLSGIDEPVDILGIDDIFAGEWEWNDQYLRCCRMAEAESSHYTILMSHRPELAGNYEYFPGDLVVCGHAHGGQWRLPGARGGVYAPGQGLFPKRAGGLYPRGKGYMLVSSGLCYRYPPIPRFGNPPEVVVLTLKPKNVNQV